MTTETTTSSIQDYAEHQHTPQQAIDEYEEQLQSAAEILNEYLIDTFGNEADWENHIGTTSIPKTIDENPPLACNPLWKLREEINSTLDWVQRGLENTPQQ